MDGLTQVKILDKYYSREIPTLYRVQHASSRAKFDDQCSLVAEEDFKVPWNEKELRQAIRTHLAWGQDGKKSSFISAWSNKSYVWQWAKRRALQDYQPAAMYGISYEDTVDLIPHPDHGFPIVFHLETLLRSLDMEPEVIVTDDEYLILGRVYAGDFDVLSNARVASLQSLLYDDCWSS